jgi:hypothetical protein
VRICFKAQAARASKRVPSHLLKRDMFWWVIGFKVQVSKLMFQGAQFLTNRNKRQATIETWHVSVSICFGAHSACAWKPTQGCLEAINTFRTCHWNNVEGLSKWPKNISHIQV